MTAIGKALGIPPSAVPAWLTLAAAHDRLIRPPVCTTAPDDWSTDAPADVRRDAVEACTFCPLLEPCRMYDEAADERHGVWGGVDRVDHRAARRVSAA